MIELITYADHRMSKSGKLCCSSAIKNGCDNATMFDPDYISGEFYSFNEEIFKHEKGAGYWLWKPYIIYSSMLKMKEGDILIYSDAGIEFVNNVNHIISRMDESVFLFTNTHPNHHWTKKLTLNILSPGWQLHYQKDTPWPQVQASVIFMRITEKTKAFIRNWLMFCQIPGLIDDSSIENEAPFFQDHRHDQSILTMVAYAYQYKLHWWPTAYAEHIRVPGDNYPVMFDHHRKRDPGKGAGQPEWT